MCRRRFGGRVQSPLAICGERLSTIEHVSHDDCCKSDSILQGAVTGDHVVLVILRNLIQAPHILWHKHFERVEIVGGLSGHSIAFGRAERHEAAGEFIGFRFAVRNEFLGDTLSSPMSASSR